jgi:hypothetical protein
MVTLREEHRLRVFEDGMLRRIFGPKRDEVAGEWRKLHNEELHDLYSSQSIIRIMKARRMRLARHVAQLGRRGPRIGRLLRLAGLRWRYSNPPPTWRDRSLFI